MSLELVEDADNGSLQVTASGKLTTEDYAQFEPMVNQLVESAGKIKVLFIMQDFHGWEVGAVWEDIKFATKHFRDIEKIAMVGEKNWERWMAAICKPFTMSKIEFFDSNQLDEARDWLSS